MESTHDMCVSFFFCYAYSIERKENWKWKWFYEHIFQCYYKAMFNILSCRFFPLF